MNEYEIYFKTRGFPARVSATNPRTAVTKVQANRATLGMAALTVDRVVQVSPIDPAEWL